MDNLLSYTGLFKKEASASDRNVGKITKIKSWYLENLPFFMPEPAEKP